MEFLYLAITVLSIAVVFLLQDRNDLKTFIEQCKALERNERIITIARHKRIFDRLDLSRSILPNPNYAIYSAVVDAYASPELLPDSLPIEAINEFNIHWLKNVHNLQDHELLELWLAGVIECPTK